MKRGQVFHRLCCTQKECRKGKKVSFSGKVISNTFEVARISPLWWKSWLRHCEQIMQNKVTCQNQCTTLLQFATQQLGIVTKHPIGVQLRDLRDISRIRNRSSVSRPQTPLNKTGATDRPGLVSSIQTTPLGGHQHTACGQPPKLQPSPRASTSTAYCRCIQSILHNCNFGLFGVTSPTVRLQIVEHEPYLGHQSSSTEKNWSKSNDSFTVWSANSGPDLI